MTDQHVPARAVHVVDQRVRERARAGMVVVEVGGEEDAHGMILALFPYAVLVTHYALLTSKE